MLVDSQPADSLRLTYLTKMRLAMSHHLRGTDSEAGAAFLDSVFSHLKKAWGIVPPAVAVPAPAPAEQVGFLPLCCLKAAHNLPGA